MSPEWLTAYADIGSAIGTVGAVITALWIAGADGRRRRRENERRQAEKISGWMEQLEAGAPTPDPAEFFVRLRVRNASEQLVYNLIASVVTSHGDYVGSTYSYRSFVGHLPPGMSEYTIMHPGYGMSKRYSIELAFVDAAGKTWVRRGRGALLRVNQDPLAYYDIDPPVGWFTG